MRAVLICSAVLNSMTNMINKATAVCKHVYRAVPAALNIRSIRNGLIKINKIRPLKLPIN